MGAMGGARVKIDAAKNPVQMPFQHTQRRNNMLGSRAVPFANDTDNSAFDIMLFSPPTLGGPELTAELFDAIRGTARQRYDVGCKILCAFQAIFSGRQTVGPVYGVTGSPADPESSTVTLVLLPNFEATARAITFYKPKRGEPLKFMELWFSRSPLFAPIDPGKFMQQYKIRVGDEVGFRSALIEILRLRKAPTDGLFFYPGDEVLV